MEATNTGKQDRLRDELQSLHQEMEIAEYGKTYNGQFRRKLPKKLSGARTKKRKLLEASDAKHSAMEVVVATDQPRLRGSRIALEETIIQGSAIYPLMGESHDAGLENNDDGEIDETDDSEDGGGGGDSDTDEEEEEELGPTTAIAAIATAAPKRRLVYRMRSFKSQRMAQRHGEALGAHARGLPREAIRKLEQVAADAPNAPQVYSSLGMVYEDMMVSHMSGEKMDGDNDGESALDETLRLAKKAYGSYHAAAVLCKKDFTLWVRAGDTAIRIVSLVNEAMQSSEGQRLIHLRTEKNQWLEDAKRDYTVADNLKPPGIDVPAKLANVQIQLCNFSEALTLLTDLKNRDAPKQQDTGYDALQPRSDFEKSYKAWWLYSDLMLRIGHESTQWNRGIRTNDNYMFKRWLRKFAATFDWQERRLLSLTLALEAAAGSEVCSEVIDWTRQRSNNHSDTLDSNGSGRWHGDLLHEPLESLENVEVYQDRDEDEGMEGVEGVDIEDNRNMDTSSENVVEKVVEGEYTDMDQDNNGDDKDDDLVPCDKVDGDSEFVVGAEVKGRTSESTKMHRHNDFEARRLSMVAANQAELKEFDERTRALSFQADSKDQKSRDAERKVLLQNHRNKIVTMVSRHLDAEATSARSRCNASLKQPLPIAASCSTVCSIASELMKHCIGLEEFEGARLVGNATSSYLKRRAALYKEREASILAFTRRQESTDNSVLLNFESYDGVAEDSSNESDGENEATYLSDEDMIEGEHVESILDSMQAGILPSELQVLYAMSLLGEGGRDLIASKTILAIATLEDGESREIVDTDVSQSKAWQMFRRASTDTLQKIPAFAFVADLLKRTNKEREWSGKLAGLFHEQVESMRKSGQLGAALEKPLPVETAQMALRRQQVLKIFLAAARLNMNNITNLMLTGKLEDAASRSFTLLDQLLFILKALWKVDDNGSVPTPCIEILTVASASISTIKPWLQQDSPTRSLETHKTAAILSSILTIVLGRPILIPHATEMHTPYADKLPEWNEFPISSDWQTKEERDMSISAYNLTVACSVTSFSGFEAEEFNLNLLKRNAGGTSYFGVSMNEGRVSGSINAEVEERLQQIWTNAGRRLPVVGTFDLSHFLAEAKKSSWFDLAGPRQDLIARYGESYVLSMLLDFADLCMLLTSNADSKNEAPLRLVLSTTLPVLQFCLGTNVWDSSIGKTITSLSSTTSQRRKASGFSMIDFSSTDMLETHAPELDGELLTSSKAKVFPSIRLRDKWLNDLSCRDPLMKIVRIPAATFLAEWKKEETSVNHFTNDGASSEAMERVETSIQSLRQSVTNAAVQKGSLQVSIALLDLVASGRAYNPFACLQHAAIYASLSPKGGNHDIQLKTVLPEEKTCTALEALVIVGRADCLQALHFPMEAIFLCNFVGRVCLGHRDRLNEDMEWNSQWKVVSIYLYNTAILLWSTLGTLLSMKEAQQKAWNGWDDEVLAELERSRLDGIALKKTLLSNDEGRLVQIESQSDDSSHSSNDDEDDGILGPLVIFNAMPMTDAGDETGSGGEVNTYDNDCRSDNGIIVAV